ncbi:TetR/AcrR family transcriptional regulator [Gordonia sp. NB41Y]|uniref:TetR/AcrR family transcriptional regulator n=1 Tax=Gordonia sp. NB41Y TaxID=875808 RepID=UPI0002BD5395|nr:TetR/AcrR family transcriptional regulator [Gordonia sp. NB41Y]EMP14847.1 hypothetical protein ISGA_300 [Gordonia sp. NB41Y]WLP90762.1 TetR/AcrR family transcriptional regulator [Gordonia sp. NB41Y]
MAERLTPEERKRRIVAATRSMIEESGPADVTLRSVARRCGMSAPGVKHHFPSMTDLFTAVLEQWNNDEVAAVERIVAEYGDDLTLPDLADSLVRHFAGMKEVTSNFDLLEAYAMAPDHPAHEAYQQFSIRPLPITWHLVVRDYENPEAVLRMLSLVVDGLRFRWLHDPKTVDHWGDWMAIRDTLFSSFTPKSGDSRNRDRPDLPDQ